MSENGAVKNSDKTSKPELQIRLFKHPPEWAAWLEKHHATSSGLWLRLAKKSAELQSLSYEQALNIALCYGWIDGQKKAHDGESWLQKFTPRGKRSIWSKINREKVARLIESGQMQPAGLAEVERAKADGRWDAAYEPASRATIPDDLQAALDANPKAREFFATLNGANRYAILFRVQTAKQAETRAKRIRQYVAMLEKAEKLYP